MYRAAQRAHPRGALGFTLIELIIALSLMAIISVLLFSALRLAGRAWDRVDALSEENDRVRVTADFLQRTLARAHRDFGQLKRGGFHGTASQMRVVSTLPNYLAQGGPRWIELAAVDAGAGRKLVMRTCRYAPRRARGDAAGGSGCRGQPREEYVLVTDIKALRLSYSAGSNSIQAGGWKGRWVNPKRLPELVRLEIETQNDTWPELILPVGD